MTETSDYRQFTYREVLNRTFREKSLKDYAENDINIILERIKHASIPFSEKLILLTDLTENPHTPATYNLDVAIDIVIRELTIQGYPPSENQILYLRDFLEGLISGLPRIIANQHFEYLKKLSDLIKMVPELNHELEKLVITSAGENGLDLKKLQPFLDYLSLEASIIALVAYTNSHQGWLDTYDVDRQIQILTRAIKKESGGSVDLPLSDAIKQLLLNYQNLLPLFQERGHDVPLKRALIQFVSLYPQFEKICTDTLLVHLQDVPKFEKNSLIYEEWQPAEKKVESVLTLDHLSPEEISQILNQLTETSPGVRVLDLIGIVLEESETRRFFPPSFYESVNDDLLLELTNIICKYPEKFLFQIGLLLTKVPFNELSPENRSLVAGELTKLDLRIKPGHKGWFLCSDAESFLTQALVDEAIVIVNDALVVKFVGKPSALCIKSHTTSDGYAFVKGNWYAPVDLNTRKDLNNSFDYSIPRITLDTGVWALMRALEPSGEKSPQEILYIVEKYVDSLVRFQGNRSKHSRVDYRERNTDEHLP